MRWFRRVLIGTGAFVMAGSCLTAVTPPAGAASHPAIWSPFALHGAKSVPVHALARTAHPATAKEPAGVTARNYQPAATWPSAGTGTASLSDVTRALWPHAQQPLGTIPTATNRAGPLPVWVSGKPGDGNVTVTMTAHRSAVAAGVDGVLLSLAGHQPDTVAVRLDYSGYAGALGGDWGSRLRLVEMPACALTRPSVAACRKQTPLTSVNDTSAQDVTANVRLSAETVVAATSTSSGSEGDYTATSLKPSGTWAVQQGDFSYSYPISVPPALGGPAPSVALGYDSQSIDGETSGTNTQASWVGDGWGYDPGFIERSYKACSKDGISDSGDECWGGYNAVLSLDGHSSVLVRDDSTGTWQLRSDDGTKVEELDGASNGVWNGEYWLVTTTDGTKYYFGLDHLPGGSGSDAATNSAWGVPVYNPSSGDPCYSSSAGTSSQCQMGYRWNLDYVVDPHGNLTVYNYATETNYYQRGGGQGTGTLTQYVRAGYPVSISYGWQLSDAIAGANPAAKVLFGTSQRCLTSSTFTDCSYSNLSSSTASHWPDVPYDQNCASSGTCTVDSPTFWSTVRLTSITTQVLEGNSYQNVDSYALTQSFPDASGASQPVMFLDSITHTGEDGTPVSLPPTTFTPTEIDNRVDGLTPAAPPLYRPRISVIASGYGASTSVTYAAPACSRVNGTMPAAADTNTMPCFPVYWTPAGEVSPILDWFNKSLVSSVTTADETGAGSPVQVTSYQYAGGAAWHQDESSVADSTYRTWNQYRGYAKVITETGVSPDPVTETETSYMRGMDGDPLSSGGKASVSVTDSLGDSVTDSDWLAGRTLETDTYTAADGTVDEKSVNGPWTFTSTASQAMPDSMPALTAELPRTDETRTLALLASGSWRDVQTDTTYNSADQVIQVDAKGDGSTSDPEICTSTAYASSSANPMMLSYPSEVTAVTGPCGTTATASTTVSDARSYYDGSGNGSLTSMGTLGAITGGGSVTGTQVISGYDSSGSPQFQAKSAATYDEYGRTLSATDANGNVASTAYTPATGALPAKIVVTNPMRWTTTTTLDPARAVPLTITDPNGNVTTETYDALGRATAVWLPGKSTSSSANDTFSYDVTGTAPTYVASSSLREDGSYATDVKIYDGMMQLREEQKTPANGAAGRLISDTFYDSHGWSVKTSASYYDDTTSPDGTLSPADDNSVPSQTVTGYDGQGRVTASKFYSLGTFQWQTTTSYPGADETSVTPPAGGTATTSFTNALGETTAEWSYSDSATPTGQQGDAVLTSYTYTPGQQVASITGNGGDKWTYGYNLLGQKTSQTDPDAGKSIFGYDADGNQTSTTDARGQTLVYTYDALNRKTAEYSGSVSAADELASWTYDTIAKGQLTSSTSYLNGAAYTEAVTGYNDEYQPTGTSTTIPSAEGSLAGTYTTNSTYSPVTDELTSTTYSADGGLPAETVRYSYDEEGLLNAFGGKTAYLDATTYSPLGQVLRTTTGLYGSQLAVTASYDEGTNRLLQTTDDVQTASSAVETTGYTYNDAGDVTSVSGTQDTGSTDTQCFTYNHLDQLVAAWTDTAGTTTAAAPSVSGIGGCDTTTPSEATVGGPSPYWESWTYNSLGDRASETVHSASGNTTQTLSYTGSQPNAVSSVATATPSGTTTTTSYSYNAAGDTTSRTSSSGSSQSFTYTPQDQVQSVTSAAGTSSYLYDSSGALLLEKDPGTTTLFLDGGAEELTRNTSAGTVTGTRYYQEPDGTTVVRSSSGALNYELASRQGTNTETVNATTLAVTRRYYDPYGDPRGAVPSSWVDNRGFLDQPADAATGLDLLGARQYDPVTGRFLQVDPVLEAGDPRQMGGYSYAADDPVNDSDPTGTMPCAGAGEGCGWGGAGGGSGTNDNLPPGGYGCDGCGSDPEGGAPPPTCPSGQHDQSGTCVDNTITVTSPGGKKVTKDANDSTCANAQDISEQCGPVFKRLKAYGYTGSSNITYQDLMNWAKWSEVGWEHFCEAFFGGADWTDCNADPYNANQYVFYNPPQQARDEKAIGGLTIMAACVLGSGGVCLTTTVLTTSLVSLDSLGDGVPAGEVASDAAVNMITATLSVGIDAMGDYEPEESELPAKGSTYEVFRDYDKFTFTGTTGGLIAVKGVAVLPDTLKTGSEIDEVFNHDGSPDQSFPIVTESR